MSEIVLDTSVWINLLATGEASAILAALDQTCLLPAEIGREVVRDPTTGDVLQQSPHALLTIPSVVGTELTAQEQGVFIDLVQGASGTRLGDGEAAAIAIAVVRGVTIAVDERKARRVLELRYPKVKLTSSHEILTSSNTLAALGELLADECVRRAFEIGRMHKV